MEQLQGYLKKVYRSAFSDEARQRILRLRSKAKRGVRGLIGSFTVRCQVCRSRNVLRYKDSSADHIAFALFICRDCGFIFVHPVPDLSNVYSYTDVPELGEGEEVWNADFLKAIESRAERKGKLLEIGFGNAQFLKLAHESGWEVYGVDLSPLFVEHARSQLQLPNIAHGTIEEMAFADEQFDVVAAFNFIEHVPDLRATLKEIRRILRPGGTLALLCPNISGIYHKVGPELFGGRDPLDISWVPPMHLSYFNKSNFKKLLESAGFEVTSDESHLTTSLWLQHQVTVGPDVTERKLEQLLDEIRASGNQRGRSKADAFHKRIVALLRERMIWAMISDLIKLEAALGAECAILYISRKAVDGASGNR